MTARGLRNNNPGNVVDGTWAQRQPGYTGSDGHFATYATPEAGLQALGALLVTYQDGHGLNTVRGIINRWAPPAENDTGAYVNAVSSAIGIGPDEPLDLHSPSVLAPLIGAIVAHENGSQPYSEAQLLTAAGQPTEEPTVATAPSVPFPVRANGVTPMPILAILSALGPILGQFIPQIAKAMKPDSISSAKDAATAQLILNTIGQAAGVLQQGQDAQMSNVAAAVEKMQADPALVQAVTKAVVNDPTLIQLLEVGGGPAQVRKDDLAAAITPGYKLSRSAVFMMSIILLPMCYWFVGSLIAGGAEIPSDWPWYAQVPFKLLGSAWNPESRSGGFNLVIGMVLGGIVGVYYGVSVTQQKHEAAAAGAASGDSGSEAQ